MGALMLSNVSLLDSGFIRLLGFWGASPVIVQPTVLGLLGLIVCWSEVSCPFPLSPHYHSDLP